ncbi:uncharacterized protein PG986_006628 [Apiospora aurea]|uniref:Uncharacterized protein n=1 Tax=Apiospora aurea TaxID=335848 RepID=A0ABR1QA90_9PEZI
MDPPQHSHSQASGSRGPQACSTGGSSVSGRTTVTATVTAPAKPAVTFAVAATPATVTMPVTVTVPGIVPTIAQAASTACAAMGQATPYFDVNGTPVFCGPRIWGGGYIASGINLCP